MTDVKSSWEDKHSPSDHDIRQEIYTDSYIKVKQYSTSSFKPIPDKDTVCGIVCYFNADMNGYIIQSSKNTDIIEYLPAHKLQNDNNSFIETVCKIKEREQEYENTWAYRATCSGTQYFSV